MRANEFAFRCGEESRVNVIKRKRMEWRKFDVHNRPSKANSSFFAPLRICQKVGWKGPSVSSTTEFPWEF
jgi:hypothetical protein